MFDAVHRVYRKNERFATYWVKKAYSGRGPRNASHPAARNNNKQCYWSWFRVF
jgi:hypothetical protein